MNVNNKVCDCGVCLSSIDSTHMDNSIQLECCHRFHNNCIKQWCEKCLDINKQPTCPFCRQIISNQYLDILNIDYFDSNFNQQVNLPQNLTHLTLGHDFNQQVNLPPNLTHLTYDFNFNQQVNLPFGI